MGCAASKDAQSLNQENSSLRSELAKKDADIARLQLQLTSGKTDQTGPSAENIQHFLIKSVPTAHAWLDTVRKHSKCNVDALFQTLGDLQKEASEVQGNVKKYQSHVDETAKGLHDEANKVKLQISDIEKKMDLSKWFREDLVKLLSCEFKVVKAEKLRNWKGGPLPKHQELEGVLGASSLTNVRVSIRDLISDSALLKSILVVSHRWVKPGLPDPDGTQQAIIVEHLKSHPEIQYVWEDWWCIPQGKRTENEQNYFEKTLENIYMLFLGAQVLLLLDMQYLGRFWTSYETWLSMRSVSQDGFSHVDDHVTIRCLGAAGAMEQSLRETWGPVDIAKAHANLSQDDIVVTNQRDKDQQLKVLQQLERDLPALISLLSQLGESLKPAPGKSFRAKEVNTWTTEQNRQIACELGADATKLRSGDMIRLQKDEVGGVVLRGTPSSGQGYEWVVLDVKGELVVAAGIHLVTA